MKKKKVDLNQIIIVFLWPIFDESSIGKTTNYIKFYSIKVDARFNWKSDVDCL